ncbi:ORF11 [Plodia interpunctella granulovirus]|uniref:ORF11 n=1 Tax=Plodia interpunctella granulovirus TaxID=262175 RepID=A0A1L5JGJ1_9BBAC|nr:ORF11 [Plodia interpunctella granulovirus]APO13895.1 ORF11 [Plodia interpunctella granulovirus]
MLRLRSLYQLSTQPAELSFHAYKALGPYRDYIAWNALPPVIRDQEQDWNTEIRQDDLIRKIHTWEPVLESWDWSTGSKLPKDMYDVLQLYEEGPITGFPYWCDSVMSYKSCKYIKEKRLESTELTTEELNYRNFFSGWKTGPIKFICRDCFDSSNSVTFDSDCFYISDIDDFDTELKLVSYELYCNFFFNKSFYWCAACKYTPLFTLAKVDMDSIDMESVDNYDV